MSMIQSIFVTILLACSGIVCGANQPSRFTRAGSTPSSSQQNQKPSSATKTLDRAVDPRKKSRDPKHDRALEGKSDLPTDVKEFKNRAEKKAMEMGRLF
ncbi:hypothetical protein DSO57_1029904 [Entomophthora muscae]|nr:hypothetical protein DSO57_1029902 [Entomophthora muscae]KAJ9048915.1 hypothetical protein DSO57_1029904 [Entomophthora muscae]